MTHAQAHSTNAKLWLLGIVAAVEGFAVAGLLAWAAKDATDAGNACLAILISIPAALAAILSTATLLLSRHNRGTEKRKAPLYQSLYPNQNTSHRHTRRRPV